MFLPYIVFPLQIAAILTKKLAFCFSTISLNLSELLTDAFIKSFCLGVAMRIVIKFDKFSKMIIRSNFNSKGLFLHPYILLTPKYWTPV